MITTVTLNASIDKAYHMTEKIENGTVMRVAKTDNSAGGKGLNVARVIKLCGVDSKATGLVGGFNGQYLESLLDADGINHEFGHIQGETRSCINILDPGYGSTEYLEGGCNVTKEEEADFLNKFPEIIKDSDVVTISGSAPKGMGKDIYQKLIKVIKDQGKQVILDTSGEYLEKGLESQPTMVKPNEDEIELLFHTKIQSKDEVITYAKRIYKEKGIPYVVISLGGDGALLVCEKGIYQGKPPKIEVANTVGCGDSMVGAFAVALEKKMEPEAALKYAVSVASANALSPHTGIFDPKDRDEIIENVEIIKDQFKTSVAFPAYNVTPASKWNFGLPENPEITVVNTGKKGFPWTPDSTPVKLKVTAFEIPEWRLLGDTTPGLPEEKIQVSSECEEIEMVPSGCTRIRMTTLPVVEYCK